MTLQTFVELWEIGGNHRFRESNELFRKVQFDGVIIVYDTRFKSAQKVVDYYKTLYKNVGVESQ